MRRIALISAILIALMVSFILGVKANPYRCTMVHPRDIIAAQHEGLLEFVDDDWGETGMACNVMGYQIVTPVYPEKDSIIVQRGDQILFEGTSSSLDIVYDQKHMSVVSVRNFRQTEPEIPFDTLTYDVHNDETGEWAMFFDHGIDGQLDDRVIFTPDKKTLRQVFVNGHWHKRFIEDGWWGVKIDDRFHRIERDETGTYVLAEETTP